MLRLICFLQGYLYVQITGNSVERFLNLCAHRNLVLRDVRITEDGCSFFISRKWAKSLGPALEKTGGTLRIIRKSGLPFLLRRYKNHLFFPAGLGLACCLILVLSAFIWRVDISGNSRYSDQVIRDFLEEKGAGYASLKRDIHCKDLQTALREHFDEITWVSAKIEGTRLSVEIRERLRGDKSTRDKEQADAPCADLAASADGVVQSITTRQGTPLVKAQDSVKKGDILVSGIVERKNDAGEITGRKYVKSDADVTIRSTISYKDRFPRSRTRFAVSEKTHTAYVFLLGGRFFPVGKLPKCDHFVEMADISQAVIGKDFYLPVRIIRIERRRTTPLKKELTKEEIREQAEKNYKKYDKKLQENGIQILHKSVMIDDSGKMVHVTGKLDVLIRQQQYLITPR